MNADKKPVVSYWHLWADAQGITHQTRCELTDFKKDAIQPGAAPQWIGSKTKGGAAVFVTALPPDGLGIGTKIQSLNGSFPCPGAGSSSPWTAKGSKWGQARYPSARIKGRARRVEKKGISQAQWGMSRPSSCSFSL